MLSVCSVSEQLRDFADCPEVRDHLLSCVVTGPGLNNPENSTNTGAIAHTIALCFFFKRYHTVLKDNAQNSTITAHVQ